MTQPNDREGSLRILLTVEEAADRLSLGRTFVYEQLKRGRLRSLRVGRCRRISVADLEEFVCQLREVSGDR